MSVEPAKKVFRKLASGETYPVPESCTPYVDANALGYYLSPVLPIVFVRSKDGVALLDARVAMRYLRENHSRFLSVLDVVEAHARGIFQAQAYERVGRCDPYLLADVIQPYAAFTDRHISLRTGMWVATPPGVSTVIGPLVNQRGPLPVHTGAIETDWHRFELFVVAEIPQFTGQFHVIEPGTPIAQLYFCARTCQERAELRFSASDPGADPDYGPAWDAMGRRLVENGRGRVVTRRGIASVRLECPHCFVSVTAAVDGGTPDVHTSQRGFNPAYRILQQAARRKLPPLPADEGERRGEGSS
jgi:hypothetical protein